MTEDPGARVPGWPGKKRKSRPSGAAIGRVRKKTEYGGVLYDSQHEARRAADLDLQLRVGHIKSWERQVKVQICINGVFICSYTPDFKVVGLDDVVVFEDAKGVRTPEYQIKKKLMLAVHGIQIKEV